MSSRTSPKTENPTGSVSLAMRLTAWYVGSSFAILLVATVWLYFILVNNVRNEQDQFLAEKVRVVRALLQRHPEAVWQLQEEVEQTWAPRQYASVYVRVLSDDGHLLAESPRMGMLLAQSAFPAPVSLDVVPQQGVSLRSASGQPVRALAARAQIGTHPARLATIQVALDTQLARQLLGQYGQTLLLVLGLSLAVCAAAGYWLARASLRPLRQISSTAQRVRSSNLDERIETSGLPAELSVLAVRFNAMLERLKESFDRLSRFSADIAHELRTPINNLRIEAEVALTKDRSPQEYRETLGSCLEECERLGRIIDCLLFIARAQDPRTQIKREPLDIAHELERVREFYEASAAEAQVSLTLSCPEGIQVDLDRTLFQRALGNLVANAIRHTPQGGRVSITAARQNGQLAVEVADTGCGIPPEDLPHVFDRFYRADRARHTSGGHVGLGLAIVKSIVSLHGGTIAAQSRSGDGSQGTRMSIRLPADAPRIAAPG